MTLQEIWYIILCKWNGARRAVSFKLGREGHTQLSCMPQMTMWFHMSLHGCCRCVPWAHTSRFVLCVILVQWSCSYTEGKEYWHQSFPLLLGLVSFNYPIHIHSLTIIALHVSWKKTSGLGASRHPNFTHSSINLWRPCLGVGWRRPEISRRWDDLHWWQSAILSNLFPGCWKSLILGPLSKGCPPFKAPKTILMRLWNSAASAHAALGRQTLSSLPGAVSLKRNPCTLPKEV